MKRSFFEKLTGSYDKDDDTENVSVTPASAINPIMNNGNGNNRGFMENAEEDEDAQLTVDVYQTNNDIIIQAVVAGVKPDDLDVSITQDMITIKGRREDHRRVDREDYFYQELFWGSFSRTILLPHEIDPDEAEATLKNGVLVIKLPKLDRERVQKVKIKGD